MTVCFVQTIQCCLEIPHRPKIGFFGSYFKINVITVIVLQALRATRDWLREESTHQGMSMVAVHILTHGTKEGILRSADEYGQGILLSDLVGSLCDVKLLCGKPKIFFVNACRGGI